MRRLTEVHGARDDHGVATIFLILAMTAIVVGAAFAIDVGGYVAAARSAQNSADATVLAVATDCALGGAPIADYSPYRKDGQTISTPYCGPGEATITVTKDVDGLLLKQSAGDVNRSATAEWGTLSKATTVPIVFSDCEFTQALLHGTTDITIYLDDTKPQSGCSSLPGGFSQLRDDVCVVEITAGGTAPGQPGAALQKLVPCITNPTAPKLPHDILIPMYDAVACQTSGCKGNSQYPIKGFAAFRLTGYSFNGNNFDGTLGRNCPDANTRGRYCLRGDFIKFTTSQGTPGPSTDFGVTQVYLSK
jgi:Flp pilus assembly protein TadG